MSYKLVHKHAEVGHYNGWLYFEVNERLVRVGVGTPNFNDYNEWRLSEFAISEDKHDPKDDNIKPENFKPLNIPDIEIDDNGIRMIELSYKYTNVNSSLTDDELLELKTKYPDCNAYLAGVMYEEDFIFTEDNMYNKNNEKSYEDRQVEFKKWDIKPNNEKTTFEKVFYPMLKAFAENYYK